MAKALTGKLPIRARRRHGEKRKPEAGRAARLKVLDDQDVA
jgi:hypothetical protein